MERGADGAMTGYAFPDMLADVVRLSKAGEREAAHDLYDAHLPLIRYEQQQGIGLAVRKYVMKRREILASDAQRAPNLALTPTAIRKSSTYSPASQERIAGLLCLRRRPEFRIHLRQPMRW